ncbi:MAG: TetR/AcrR family transcriptional regulator [Flavobacterium sp.]|nr:MAG: TetR/AcrR family transcriptional regulator [Flavobacterium sp.]
MTTEFNDKQRKILSAAEILFAENGFDGTSIRDIAKEAGVNIAMISYYFGSKEKMLESLMFSRMSDLKIQIMNLRNEASSPLEKIEKLIEIYIARICKNRGIYKIMYFELNNQQRSTSGSVLAEIKKNNLEYITQIIRDGQAEGAFRKDIIIELIPTTIVGTLFHFNLNSPFYMELFGLKDEAELDDYIKNQLTQHIQQTIKALLLHEK